MNSKNKQKNHKFYQFFPWLSLLGVALVPQISLAEGSANLINSGGDRPYLEWQGGNTGGFLRRGTIKVYANRGETINLGSSAAGIGLGTINFRAPNGTSGTCGAAGNIANITQEQAGPNTINPAGYTPCVITAAQTTAAGDGIWEIDFVSPNPNATNINPTRRLATAPWLTQAPTDTWTNAWDVTVRDTGGGAQAGRAYADYLPLNAADGLGALSSQTYIKTNDGYVYTVDLNGVQPFGFIFFANQKGFINTTTGNPIYQSVCLTASAGNTAPCGVNGTGNLSLPTGIQVDPSLHKIFFNTPNLSLPPTAQLPNGSQTWLNPPQASPPIPTGFAFTGTEGTNGQAGVTPLGGNFTFNAPTTGTYRIAIDVNQDGDTNDPIDRILLGSAVGGLNTIPWDGRDGQGNPVPPSVTPYGASITLNAGEIHFPFFDAENNGGGIRVSGPTSTLYYDDRNVPVFPGQTPPNPVNGLSGAPSPSHVWGITNGTQQQFGENKAIDTWAFLPSLPVVLQGGVTIKAADLKISKTNTIGPNVAANSPITYTVNVTNAGPSNVTNAGFVDTVPAGITNVTWSCAITTGTGACNTASGTGNSINTTLNLNSGAVATYTINGIVSPTATGNLVNRATVNRPLDVSDPVDDDNSGGANTSESANNTITVGPASADLAVGKTDGLTTVNAGDTSSYVINVTNNGPSIVNSLTLTDTLPAGFTASTYTASTGNYDSATGSWTGLNLLPQQSITLTIAGTVSPTATGTLTNTATVRPPDGTNDPTPGNNTATDTTTINVPTADLSVAKTDNLATINAGANNSYVITVTNNGPSTVNSLTLADTPPAGFTVSTYTPSTGTYDSATGAWTGLTLASGQTITLTIAGTVSATATGTLTNTVRVQPPAGVTDPTPGNDTATDDTTINVPTADLSVAKTDNLANVNPGANSSYVITVTNNGPSTVNSLTLTDTPPAGFTASTYTASAGTYDNATGAWTGLTLASGQSITLTIAGTVSATATGTLTNTVSVQPSGGVTDPTPGNNSATDTTTINVLPADLSLQKTVNTTTPTLNGNLTYTLTLRNSGPGNATNVAVTDQLPAGLTFVSSNPSQGSYNQATGVWTVGNIGSNGTVTLQITATRNSANAVTNTAQVTASDQPDPDSTPGNNNPAEDDQSSVTLPPLAADLRLSKTVDNSTPLVGQNVNFTVRVTNDGPATATNVQITDTLPAGLTFVSASNGGTYNPNTRQVVWNIPSLSNGGNIPLTITATVNNAVTQSNRAEVTASDQPDPDSTPGNGNTNEDDSASVTLTQQPPADISVIKSVNNPNPTPGQQITYTIQAQNNGPGNATGLQITEQLAPGLTFVSATSTPGTTYDSGTGIWNIGSLANGVTSTLTITATYTATTQVTNTATVTSSDQTDPNPGNNSSSATVPNTPADLGITKTVDKPNATPGETITYTITLTNNGPGNASDVVVTDQIPAGLTLQTATPAQGSYNQATGVWTVGNLANGANTTLTITARVNTTSPITNTAQVTGADQPDSNPNNNTASVTTPQQGVDLVLAKSVDNPNPLIGQQFNYTIKVTNTGPGNATNVTITDQLPAGVTFVSANPSVGTYDRTTGLWTVGNINNTQSATLQITVVLNAANATNSAQITGVDQTDSNPGNNQSSVTVPNGGADLSLAKTSTVANPPVGSNFTYTVTLSNSGPQDATGVQVTDRLPAGVTYVSSTPSAGTYDPTTGLWNVGSIANGATATLQVTVTKNAAGPVTNVAQVTASNQPDPDSTPGNNNPSEDDQATLTLPQEVADLSLRKAASNLSPTPGTAFTYTVTLRNNGPATATNVQVLEQVPEGVTFNSATASIGSYDRTTGLWTVPSLPNAGTATLQLNVTLNTDGIVTNTAQVQASDQSDPNSTPGNNNPSEDDQASLSLPTRPRVRLVKRITALNGTAFNEVVDDAGDTNDNAASWPQNFLKGRIDQTIVQPGDEVEYTIYFLSDGGAQAANVNLCDLVPVALQYLGNAFGTNRGISLLYNSVSVAATNSADGDPGQFYAPGEAIPNIACRGTNTNGAVVVNLGTLPSATGPNPTAAYGYFRFRAKFLQ